MSEKVLILGGSYFIGRKMALELTEMGYEVSILNRGTKPCPSEKIEQIICDRNSYDDMRSVLQNREFDYMIDVSWQDIEWVKTLCSSASFNKLKAFVFISSSAVYDVEKLDIPFKEEDRLAPNKYWTFYGEGKIDAENYYQEFFRNKDSQLFTIRPPYIYGEFNYVQRESFIFKHILEEKEIIIPASNPKLQFTYSGDLAEIIAYLLKNDTSKTAIYNVGNKKAITSKEWVDLCSEIVGKPAKVIECEYSTLSRNVRDFFPFFDYDNVLDVSKINKIYTKELDFSEGLKRAYQWFLQYKDEIVFKQNVEQNIYEMILELNK